MIKSDGIVVFFFFVGRDGCVSGVDKNAESLAGVVQFVEAATERILWTEKESLNFSSNRQWNGAGRIHGKRKKKGGGIRYNAADETLQTSNAAVCRPGSQRSHGEPGKELPKPGQTPGKGVEYMCDWTGRQSTAVPLITDR